jgi:hypothetical protein
MPVWAKLPSAGPQPLGSLARNGVSKGLPNLPRWLSISVLGFLLNMPRSGTLQESRWPAHLQASKCLHALFNTFSSHSYTGTSRGGRSGPRCPHGGHLALRLASTVHGFSTLTLPILAAEAIWGQPRMAGALSDHAPPLSKSSGGFKHAGRHAASGSTPSPGSMSHSRLCVPCTSPGSSFGLQLGPQAGLRWLSLILDQAGPGHY